MLRESDSQNDNFEVRFFEGINLFQQERLEEALEHFLRMLVEYPNSVGVLVFLGQIYQDLGNLDLAVKYALKGTQLSPVSELSSFLLHKALRDSGLRRKAYDEMERYFNTSGAQISLYNDHLIGLAEALHIPYMDFTDKKKLAESVIEALEKIEEL